MGHQMELLSLYRVLAKNGYQDEEFGAGQWALDFSEAREKAHRTAKGCKVDMVILRYQLPSAFGGVDGLAVLALMDWIVTLLKGEIERPEMFAEEECVLIVEPPR